MEGDISFGSDNQEEEMRLPETSKKQYFHDEIAKLDFSSYNSKRLHGHRVSIILHSTYFF